MKLIITQTDTFVYYKSGVQKPIKLKERFSFLRKKDKAPLKLDSLLVKGPKVIQAKKTFAFKNYVI